MSEGFGVCVLCRETKPMRNRGFCTSCYMRAKRNGTFEQYALPKQQQAKWGNCDDCGVYCHIQGHGRCKACYRKWYYSHPNVKEWHAAYERDRRQRYHDRYIESEMRRARTERRQKWRVDYQRQYYDAHAEHLRAYVKQWRQNNQALVQYYSRTKYMNRKRAEGHITKEQWDCIVAHYCPDGHCIRCGQVFDNEVTPKKLTLDHVIPITDGGSHWPSNIQPLCYSCNCSKSNHAATDYRQDKGEFARSLLCA